jgi:formylglycine-generating enzyme required for sulfatase activity
MYKVNMKRSVIKKLAWLCASILFIGFGIVMFTWLRPKTVDGVTSASVRIISTGEKDIKKTRILKQDKNVGSWIEISNVVFRKEWTEYGGSRLAIEYDLAEEGITPETPAYIFIRYRSAENAPWQLLPFENLNGNGHAIVDHPGHKVSYFWGAYQSAFDNFTKASFRVRGIKMSSVEAGEFEVRRMPGGGKDDTQVHEEVSGLPLFYMARYETTIGMYTDYLNEVASTEEIGWNPMMKDDSLCGIIRRKQFLGHARFLVVDGREDFPVTQVSWYNARAFLQWCGLRLPLEAEYEKAFQGGIYLDGDASGESPNPNPLRIYPWGNTPPDANGIYRCNAYGSEDGYTYTAPVGSFEKYNSPYNIADLSGNVGEWTLDRYSTSYHVGLDGYRMIRGASWMEFPLVADVISGATRSPILESGIVGFRGIYD